MRIAVIYRELFLLLLTTATCHNAPTAGHSHDKAYWYDKNYKLIHERMQNVRVNQLPPVRNVVFFIGDGMGISTITASRVMKRQISRNPNAQLAFDDFPATGLVQTDLENSQISESAASSTALFCGVKTNFENLGVDATASSSDACTKLNSHTPSIIAWAQEKNLKTGFVTTTRVTHATPAALYAHSRRYAEDDSKVDAVGCVDIARQLIENSPGRDMNVIMGGGMKSFIGGSDGRRLDGRNLTAEWLSHHPNGEFVTNYNQMLAINASTEHVLGIFAHNHMKFNADRDRDVEPSLAEMTQMAIDVLKRNNQKGFVLIVEAGKIDLAHHTNKAYRALDDTLALDEAVEAALRNLDLSQSLIIVTADHSSGMSYSGYETPKSYSILGMDKYPSNFDNRPYQLLTYSSGYGSQNYSEKLAREDPHNAIHMATIAAKWGYHGADDVPLYAIGSMSSLFVRTAFGGTYDQSYVPHAIAYAMCLFKYESRCQQHQNEVYVERKRPQHGIEALRQELNAQKHRHAHTTVSAVEEVTVTSTEVATDDGFRNDTQSDKFESSDLVSNLTAAGNSSCSAFRSNFAVLSVATTVISINLIFH